MVYAMPSQDCQKFIIALFITLKRPLGTLTAMARKVQTFDKIAQRSVSENN